MSEQCIGLRAAGPARGNHDERRAAAAGELSRRQSRGSPGTRRHGHVPEAHADPLGPLMERLGRAIALGQAHLPDAEGTEPAAQPSLGRRDGGRAIVGQHRRRRLEPGGHSARALGVPRIDEQHRPPLRARYRCQARQHLGMEVARHEHALGRTGASPFSLQGYEGTQLGRRRGLDRRDHRVGRQNRAQLRREGRLGAAEHEGAVGPQSCDFGEKRGTRGN